MIFSFAVMAIESFHLLFLFQVMVPGTIRVGEIKAGATRATGAMMVSVADINKITAVAQCEEATTATIAQVLTVIFIKIFYQTLIK